MLLPIASEAALCLLPSTRVHPADTHRLQTDPRPVNGPALPPGYGRVIYRRPGRSDRHIFIIGNSHRNALTRRNGANTVQTQVELYKIGEWLIQTEGVELLLPEGFFQRAPDGREPPSRSVAPRREAEQEEPEQKHVATTRPLEELFSDDALQLSAEMVLKARFGLQIHQVEDEKLYFAVGDCLRTAQSLNGGYNPIFFDMELDYLQERRTVAMLQNIPGAVEAEFQSGHIQSRKAVFTIGMNHLDEIIRYLEENRISIASPLASTPAGDYEARLLLSDRDYGVTVILPRALLEDKQALQLTKLDQRW